MAASAQIVVKMNRLPAIAAKCRPAVRAAIHAAGFRTEAAAKAAAPVDTGALRARIANRPGDLSTTVGVAAGYAAFVERGTRKMAARPYLEPAVNGVVPQLNADLAEAVKP